MISPVTERLDKPILNPGAISHDSDSGTGEGSSTGVSFASTLGGQCPPGINDSAGACETFACARDNQRLRSPSP